MVTVTYIRINFLQSLMLLYKLPKNLVTQFVPLNCLMLYIATNILLIYFTATWLDSFFVVIVSSHINFSKIDQIQEKVKKIAKQIALLRFTKSYFFPNLFFLVDQLLIVYGSTSLTACSLSQYLGLNLFQLCIRCAPHAPW